MQSSPSSSPTVNSGSVPLCICATCGASHQLPRPDPSQPTFQCQQCRIAGTDVKILYVKRSIPQEHYTW